MVHGGSNANERTMVGLVNSAEVYVRKLWWSHNASLCVKPTRELERLLTELDREIRRRYRGLDYYWRTIPGISRATAHAI
jgi:hypothetical protein